MKRLLFSALLCIVGFMPAVFSQTNCTRNISQFSSVAGGYAIAGNATLVRQNDGTLKLTFSNNFATTAGPDLKVYLSKNLASPTASGNTHLEVAPLVAAAGGQSYIISGTKIDAFQYVLIHCKAFNHLWGGGLLGTPTGNCTSTAREEESPETPALELYPNPVQNGQLFMSQNGSVQVFDILGREVIPTKQIESATLDVSHLARGTYLIRINQAITKMFVVQ